ncbi:Uncharacterized protein TPAR_06837 [Tolypocladium paradoxum]|uniref:Uncharacterized protein n=1 Tax=Tolypocladium paradoxum TaxID=94208 RepID=A0A2S4KRZ3_9HYPO|nr:Uncharacterized protein TPAR_06837 [Tolypocladium paradoxum]
MPGPNSSQIQHTSGPGGIDRLDVHSLSNYDKMILHIDKIQPYHFGLAGFFSWLLLAGFLVSPSTYASVRYLDAPEKTGDIGKAVVKAMRNIPLIFIASFACLIATINRYLIVPTVLHSVMGLVSTLLNVYGMQDGQWSVTTIISMAIIGGLFLFSLTAYAMYELVLLPSLKIKHWTPTV